MRNVSTWGEEYSLEISENLAACQITARNYDEAINLLDRRFSKKWTPAVSFFLIGLAYHGKGDTLNAIKFLEKSIKSDSSFTPAYLSLAKIKKDSGNLQQGIALC